MGQKNHIPTNKRGKAFRRLDWLRAGKQGIETVRALVVVQEGK